MLIISADAKGKDSMILFKIKETANINSGHVLLRFGSHVMMALTQENVHYTLNSGSGVMNKSNRVHARRGGGGVGGGGVGGGGRGPTARKQSGQCFFSHQLILQFTEWIQWFYYRGEEGVQLLPGGGDVQRNPYNL